MPDEEARKPLCFAIMPITTPPELLERYGNDAEHFIRVARYIFRPAAEAAGFEFKTPASTSAEIIQAEIIKNLAEADLVLCDISTWNANVFFELGIRVALDRPVAVVRDHHTDRIPFDNSMINTHTYDGRLNVYRVEETVPALTAFLGAKSQDQNALWKYFGITQRAARTDPGVNVMGGVDDLTHEVDLPAQRELMTSPEFGRALYVRTGWEPPAWVAPTQSNASLSPVPSYDLTGLIQRMRAGLQPHYGVDVVKRAAEHYYLPKVQMEQSSPQPLGDADIAVLHLLDTLDDEASEGAH